MKASSAQLSKDKEAPAYTGNKLKEELSKYGKLRQCFGTTCVYFSVLLPALVLLLLCETVLFACGEHLVSMKCGECVIRGPPAHAVCSYLDSEAAIWFWQVGEVVLGKPSQGGLSKCLRGLLSCLHPQSLGC